MPKTWRRARKGVWKSLGEMLEPGPPNFRLDPTKRPTGTTPVPNSVLDVLLPELSDTELRVLLVVVRVTRGWSEGKERRKERDWLSHAQIKARTGRASAAVSAAIDGLVKRDLIRVEDELGNPLTETGQRRRAGRNLFFRLEVDSKREKFPNDFVPAPTFSESEIRKAKTTKETGTIVFENNLLSFSQSEKVPNERGFPETQVLTGSGVIAQADHGWDRMPDEVGAEVSRVLEAYRTGFLEAFGHEADVLPTEIEALSAAERSHGASQLETRLHAFFKCDFGYVRRRGYSMQSFLDTLSILRVAGR